MEVFHKASDFCKGEQLHCRNLRQKIELEFTQSYVSG